MREDGGERRERERTVERYKDGRSEEDLEETFGDDGSLGILSESSGKGKGSACTKGRDATREEGSELELTIPPMGQTAT